MIASKPKNYIIIKYVAISEGTPKCKRYDEEKFLLLWFVQRRDVSPKARKLS